MNKLNRKGFTLIELLAVIIILSIIVVVTVPTILTSVADARVMSLSNLAKSVANSYDTASAQDLLSPGKALGGIEDNSSLVPGGNWVCISSLETTNTAYYNPKTTLDKILRLSDKDVVLTGTAPSGNTDPEFKTIFNNKTGLEVNNNTCSAIRIQQDGSADILLVAQKNGKFDINLKTVYALSTKDAGHAFTEAERSAS